MAIFSSVSISIPNTIAISKCVAPMSEVTLSCEIGSRQCPHPYYRLYAHIIRNDGVALTTRSQTFQYTQLLCNLSSDSV